MDLAVLNAGVLGRIADLRDVPVEELKQVMDVNLWANKALVDALLAGPREVAQIVTGKLGPAIVQITSALTFAFVQLAEIHDEGRTDVSSADVLRSISLHYERG